VLQIVAFFITQSVSTRKILVQTSGVIFHVNTRKKIYINMISQTFFEAQFPHWPEHNPLGLYFWLHLKTPLYAVTIKNEAVLQKRNFYACQNIRNCLQTLETVW